MLDLKNTRLTLVELKLQLLEAKELGIVALKQTGESFYNLGFEAFDWLTFEELALEVSVENCLIVSRVDASLTEQLTEFELEHYKECVEELNSNKFWSNLEG